MHNSEEFLAGSFTAVIAMLLLLFMVFHIFEFDAIHETTIRNGKSIELKNKIYKCVPIYDLINQEKITPDAI